MSKKKSRKPVPVKKPRQARLPGTEDAKIEEFHAIAEELFDHRTKRLEHGKAEADLNERLLKLMRSRGKETYSYQGMKLTIVPKKEFVRVKIADGGPEASDS